MSHHYSDPDREDDTRSLPDVEVFHADGLNQDVAGLELEAGWYYWFCMPGCLPDSDPHGPFETAQDALNDAREQAEE